MLMPMLTTGPAFFTLALVTAVGLGPAPWGLVAAHTAFVTPVVLRVHASAPDTKVTLKPIKRGLKGDNVHDFDNPYFALMDKREIIEAFIELQAGGQRARPQGGGDHVPDDADGDNVDDAETKD